MIYIKLTDAKTGKPIKNAYFDMSIYKNNKEVMEGEFVFLQTDSHGKVKIDWGLNCYDLGTGVFKIKIYALSDSNLYDYDIADGSKTTAKVIINKCKPIITAKKLTTKPKSGKAFKIKLATKNKKPIRYGTVELKVYTGKKYKSVFIFANSKGVVLYKKASKLSVGKHKVKISIADKGYYKKSVTSYIIIKKSTSKSRSSKPATLSISAPKIVTKYKKSTLFKVTVKNKKSGKSLKGVKVIMKVYTGKKFKKIVHKTNKKGKTGFNTKSLSKGKHKVVVIVKANSKYKKAVKKSSVTIKGKTNNNKNNNKKSNSKNKNKKSSTKKGKLRTKLTIKECYRTDNIGEIFIKVSLKDSKGRPLANKEISIDTVAYMGPMSQPTYNTATTDSNGIAQGYVTSMFGGIATYDVTVKFSGDKSHKSSSASTYLG